MEQSPALEDCLKLLRGERDEQRLAGLLLATKLLQGDDNASVLKVYDAVGVRFLDRLLMTGMGKASAQGKGEEERAAYLRLSVTVVAAFCRVPEIASSEDMVAKVPLVLEIISKSSDMPIIEECYEILLLVATMSEEGFTRLYESGIMKVLASNVSTLPDGSHSMELAMKLLQLILTKLPSGLLISRHPSEISHLVQTIARQFAVLHNALKFDALHLLATIMSSREVEMLHNALRSVTDKVWAAYMRIGILAVLQNRVASVEKLRALVLVESTMSIVGEKWLLNHTHLPDDQNPLTVDKSLLLVLESARVEIAVLLNELAYMKYEASKGSSAESIKFKQMNLAVLFSLLEKIIKLISDVCGTHGTTGSSIGESTSMKVIDGLNETVDLVLDFLHDAKDHGQRKGDDLLASVRIIGRYLAEAPSACKEKTEDLLEYILSIEGEDESSPFYSICFMLPFLCQSTMEIDGCNTLASFGGHKVVAKYLAKFIALNRQIVEDDGTIFLACDTIINILLNSEKIQSQLDGSDFIELLQALVLWAGNSEDASVVMMATTICSLVFDLTSEEGLLMHDGVDPTLTERISQLFVKSLSPSTQCGRDNIKEHLDLHQIITAGLTRWASRYPRLKQAIERSSILQS